MAKIWFSPAAKNDIDRIWEYTAQNWGEAQAVRYIRDIQTVCEGLTTGETVSRSIDSIRAGYRKSACGSHMVYYKHNDERISIIRILHQSMDVERHI